jgi:hypothetical protein
MLSSGMSGSGGWVSGMLKGSAQLTRPRPWARSTRPLARRGWLRLLARRCKLLSSLLSSKLLRPRLLRLLLTMIQTSFRHRAVVSRRLKPVVANSLARPLCTTRMPECPVLASGQKCQWQHTPGELAAAKAATTEIEGTAGGFTESGFMAAAAPLTAVSDKLQVASRKLRFAESVSNIDTVSFRQQPSAAKWAEPKRTARRSTTGKYQPRLTNPHSRTNSARFLGGLTNSPRHANVQEVAGGG